ncbi:hypothetical protein FQN60_007290 [Etheostoma spectabile]|uniref:Uncharacterized protein n=1 Tax=Etheostoma spectabile TaxID=54343 RepID=A0A5J5CBT0_9PERO|nr:hypothetical protein FQN60_007290 [Etheostoma spectabile]
MRTSMLIDGQSKYGRPGLKPTPLTVYCKLLETFVMSILTKTPSEIQRSTLLL